MLNSAPTTRNSGTLLLLDGFVKQEVNYAIAVVFVELSLSLRKQLTAPTVVPNLSAPFKKLARYEICYRTLLLHPYVRS